MKWTPAKNSLFAVLLRSPWWISFAIAGGVYALAQLFLPTAYALFVPLPFFGIGCIAAWRQFQAPSAAQVSATLEAVRAMSWPDFARVAEAAFRREGYSVSRPAAGVADFELIKAGRISLVSGKRWKVARAGVEPLRDLQAAKEAAGAQEGLFLAAGEVTENARAFAKQNQIRVLEGAELARLLRESVRKQGS